MRGAPRPREMINTMRLSLGKERAASRPSGNLLILLRRERQQEEEEYQRRH